MTITDVFTIIFGRGAAPARKPASRRERQP